VDAGLELVEEDPEDTKKDSKSDSNSITSHICSRGHKNDYSSVDYMDWSGPETF
jgi:hypothetical protein